MLALPRTPRTSGASALTRRRAAITIAMLLASAHCAGSPAPSAARSPVDPGIAFVGVTVLPLETARALPDQTVLVVGDRIARSDRAGADSSSTARR